jgi:hypothetical protein
MAPSPAQKPTSFTSPLTQTGSFCYDLPVIGVLTVDGTYRSGFITFDEFLHATIQYHWDVSLLKGRPQQSQK